MRILTHTLLGILAIALVLPVAHVVLVMYGVNFVTVVLLMLLVAATLLALHNVRVTVDDYLIYRTQKRLDTADRKG